MSEKSNFPDSKEQSLAEQVADKLHLEGVPRNSFLQLCQEGCDPRILGEHLICLTSKSEIPIRPKGKKGGGEDRRSYNISLRPLDSVQGTLNDLEKRDLESLQEKLLIIAEDVNTLNQTRLVRYLNDDEYNREIWELSRLLGIYANHFIPILLKKIEKSGPKQRPNYTSFLTAIYEHINKKTGKWHDALVADIFNALNPENTDTEQSLKQWRKRHALIDKRGT